MVEFPNDHLAKAYFDYIGRCDQAFRPHAPIELPEFFAGRVKHVERLNGEIAAPGRHAAIFGERGVGKTSLAKLAYFFLRRNEEDTYFVRCNTTSTFDTIFANVLTKAGLEFVLNGVETSSERRGGISTGPVAAGGRRATRQNFRRVTGTRQIDPNMLLEKFENRNGLIIIDEYDRVKDDATHTHIAELVKHFSDAESKTKIILVGVAETLSQLIGEHESLSRCLAEIRLDRMQDEELREIVKKGEQHVGATFKETIRHRIIRLADGFPYFAHLLCRHACRNAGKVLQRTPDETPVVAEREYHSALQDALDNAENSLAEQYENAIVTTRRKSDKFELLLWAMALSDKREVQVQDIATNVTFFTGQTTKTSSFSSNLGTLSGEARGRVLTKVRVGYYKFSNPLMRPYIRILLERDNHLIPGSQSKFPFMQ